MTTPTSTNPASSSDKAPPTKNSAGSNSDPQTTSLNEDFLRSTSSSLAALDTNEFEREEVAAVLNAACCYDDRGEYRRRMRMLRRVISGHLVSPMRFYKVLENRIGVSILYVAVYI